MAYAHGASGYTNHRCRCDVCREAHTAACGRSRANRIERLAADPTLAPHGKSSTYRNWGCRCAECREANVRHCAEYGQQRKSRTAGGA